MRNLLNVPRTPPSTPPESDVEALSDDSYVSSDEDECEPAWDAQSTIQAQAERCRFLERQLAEERLAHGEYKTLQATIQALTKATAKAKIELAEAKARADRVEKKARECERLRERLEEEEERCERLEEKVKALQANKKSKGGAQSEAIAHARYDQQWGLLVRLKKLVGDKGEALKFEDIPWPTFTPPTKPEDITKDEVSRFIMSSSTSQLTRKGTKEQMLTWHPDKFCGRWLPHVVDGDKAKVQQGTSKIAQLLNDIMSEARN